MYMSCSRLKYFAANISMYTNNCRHIHVYNYKLLQTYSCIQVIADIFVFTSCCRHSNVYKLLQTYSCIQIAADRNMLLQTNSCIQAAADRCMLLQTDGFKCLKKDIFECLQTDLQKFLKRYKTSENGCIFSTLCVNFAWKWLQPWVSGWELGSPVPPLFPRLFDIITSVRAKGMLCPSMQAETMVAAILGN